MTTNNLHYNQHHFLFRIKYILSGMFVFYDVLFDLQYISQRY